MLIFSLPVYAQVVVKGSIADNELQKIPYAVVIAQSLPDSSVIKMELADSVGNYLLTVPDNKKVLLKISAPSYNAEYKLVTISQNETVANFVLSIATNSLKAVTVTAQKPLIERRIDRTIFNVESSVSSIGTDAFELMKKAPGVRVNNGSISIAGKNTVNVMIDDRLVPVSGEELEGMLRSISTDNISRLEVITTPPAKYDAAGNAGIINIVTKKQKSNGFNGMVTATYQQRVKASERLEGSFNWRAGKWNIYGNMNQSNYTFTSPQRIETSYPNQQQTQSLLQQNRPFYSRNQLGIDYNINSKSVIGILYTYGKTYRDMDQLYTVNNIRMPENINDSVNRTFAYTFELADRTVVNLNYEWNIDTTGKKLSVDVEFFSRWGGKRRDFNARTLQPDGAEAGARQYNKTTGVQTLTYQTAKADMLLPYKWAKLSLGGKASFINTNSDNIFRFYNGSDYVVDNNRTNIFDYQERIQTVYISIQKQWSKKWEGQAGLRAEYTQTKGVSKTMSQSNTNEYFKIFPTAYLKYQPNDNHVLILNYSKRIDRPEFWDMNPFRQYTTAVSYEEGNPFLQPSFSNNIEAGYTLKDKYTFTAYANFEDGIITEISKLDSINKSYAFVMANAGRSSSYGFSGTGVFEPTKWWELYTEVYAYYERFSSSVYNSSFANSIPTASLVLNNTFTLNNAKTLLAEVNFYGITSQQSDFNKQRAYWTMSTGVKALFLDKRLIVAATVNDIFKTDIWYVRNLQNGAIREGYFDARALFISASWKFGNRYIKEKRQRNSSEESSRAN
jgi:outer membrane receptor protein involved in Fe transport